jgi:hypothetical protein
MLPSSASVLCWLISVAHTSSYCRRWCSSWCMLTDLKYLGRHCGLLPDCCVCKFHLIWIYKNTLAHLAIFKCWVSNDEPHMYICLLLAYKAAFETQKIFLSWASYFSSPHCLTFGHTRLLLKHKIFSVEWQKCSAAVPCVAGYVTSVVWSVCREFSTRMKCLPCLSVPIEAHSTGGNDVLMLQ